MKINFSFSQSLFLALFSLTLSISFVSCSPQKRFSRLIKYHPELLERTVDTILIPAKQLDTAFKESKNQKDTIIIKKNNMIVKYFHHRDTVYLSSKYLGDTLKRPKYYIKNEVNNSSNNGFWVLFNNKWILISLIILLIALALYLFGKNSKK